MKLLFILLVPFYLNAQSQVYLDLSIDQDTKSTVKTLSNPIVQSPFTTFENAFVSNCNESLEKEALIFEKSITRKFPFILKTRKKNIYNKDLVGISIDVDFVLQNDFFVAKQNTIKPFFEVHKWKEKNTIDSFLLKPMEGFKNKEYSFLIKSYFEQDDLPKISDRLSDIYNGEPIENLLDYNYVKTDLASIKQSMIEIDTFVVLDCYSGIGDERIVIRKEEYHFDDLEIEIISEVSYCSESNSFDIEILYYGMALPMVDPETLRFQYRKRKFLVPNNNRSE